VYIDKGLGGILRLFANYVYDKSTYASDQQTALYIRAGLPNQSTVEQMDGILLKMENELGKHREIDRFISEVDDGQRGSIVVYFKKPHDDGHFPYQLKAKAIALSTEMSGIDWDIYGVGQGFNINAIANNTPAYKIMLKGYDYKELENVANKLKNKLIAHPRVQEVDINSEPGSYGQKDLFAYKFNTDSYYWGGHGISKRALYAAIYPFNARPRPDLYQLMGESYEGFDIQPVATQSFDLVALNSVPLLFQDSIGLKLGGNAELIKEKVAPNIRKEDQEYLRQVTFNYMGSTNFGEEFLTKTLMAFEQELPMGYSAKIQSYDWWQLGARQQYELVILSLVFIFIIGTVFFESLRQPFSLILGIVFSFIGLFLSFYLTDMSFDQGGYTSFLLVAGTVSFPILAIINMYNSQRHSDEKKPLLAYQQAIHIELVPILLFLCGMMTSLTGILIWGLEQPFWSALAVGSLGGIFGSVIVVLFFIPIFLIAKCKV
jgi:multidrug efflux pump subunit AcrB